MQRDDCTDSGKYCAGKSQDERIEAYKAVDASVVVNSHVDQNPVVGHRFNHPYSPRRAARGQRGLCQTSVRARNADKNSDSRLDMYARLDHLANSSPGTDL